MEQKFPSLTSCLMRFERWLAAFSRGVAHEALKVFEMVDKVQWKERKRARERDKDDASNVIACTTLS